MILVDSLLQYVHHLDGDTDVFCECPLLDSCEETIDDYYQAENLHSSVITVPHSMPTTFKGQKIQLFDVDGLFYSCGRALTTGYPYSYSCECFFTVKI